MVIYLKDRERISRVKSIVGINSEINDIGRELQRDLD